MLAMEVQGVELGLITASISWSFCSATLEPSRSPREAGSSDAPEALMGLVMCPCTPVKAEGVLTGVR